MLLGCGKAGVWESRGPGRFCSHESMQVLPERGSQVRQDQVRKGQGTCRKDPWTKPKRLGLRVGDGGE